MTNKNTKIHSIEINKIHILNPRVRNQKVFMDMVENIKKVGLKRPITVMPSKSNVLNKSYDLVCGQGRIEALQLCGQTHISAIIIYDSENIALLKGLVENLARRQHQPLERLTGIKLLVEKKYTAKTISRKTGLNAAYVKSIMSLLKRGESRLLAAVEQGHLPVHVAMQISLSPDDEQKALHEAYEKGELRGEKLKLVQKLLEIRKLRGKNKKLEIKNPDRITKKRVLTGQDILNIYQKEVTRKQMLARKADRISRQILFITTALKQLFQEDHFTTLLRAEGMTCTPKQLGHLIGGHVDE